MEGTRTISRKVENTKMKHGFTLIEVMVWVCILGLSLAIVIPVACKQRDEKLKRIHDAENNVDYSVKIIDGCEYIDNKDHFGDHIYSHKGNCINSIHIYNKEIK